MTITRARVGAAVAVGGLPDRWQTVRFDQMAQNITVRVDNPSEAGVERYVGLEHLDPDTLRIRRWGTPGDVEATKLRFQPGDIIFGRRRAYQRKLAVADFEGICSAHALVLRAREETVAPEFLPFFMQSEAFFQRAMAISVGSLSPTINWTTLAQQEFAIPPLGEQRRIAELLWAAEESAFASAMVAVSVQRCRIALSSQAFEPTGKRDEGQDLKLADVLVYASDGPFGSKLKTEHYAAAGARVVRLQNIGSGTFNDNDRSYISESYYRDLNRYALHSGDIIVAGLGDEKHPVGRACKVPAHLGPSVNKADCFCLRGDTSLIQQDYLLYFLNSPHAQHQIRQSAQGTTRLRINIGNLKRISIQVPDHDTQSRICRAFAALDEAGASSDSDIISKKAVVVGLRESLLGVTRRSNV